MALSCRQAGHTPHIWPSLPLKKDHMIYACEQYCQWCPSAGKDLKRWETATGLRKHAKYHIAEDSQFTIQTAGKGGRKRIILQNTLVDTQALYHMRVQEAMSSTTTIDQLSTSQLPESVSGPPNQAETSKERVTNPTMVLSSQRPPIDQEVSINSTPPSVNRTCTSPQLGSGQLATEHESATEEQQTHQSSMESPILNDNQSDTSSLSGISNRDIPESPTEENTPNEILKSTQTIINRQSITNPSIHDVPTLPEITHSIRKNQKITDNQLIPLRRTRSETSSSISVRRSKRVQKR